MILLIAILCRAALECTPTGHPVERVENHAAACSLSIYIVMPRSLLYVSGLLQ